ncbi:MAG: formate dehydrogenase accessory sulfurtransferase FdhD [Dehalococcoidia bacterium]|nr:formate dehydrogenase accessory sulfurtransferase FdhD [Dehalococcoidia bacterium]
MDVLENVNAAEQVRLVRITEGIRTDVEDVVVRESSLTIVLDNQELVTMLCSPIDLKPLAVGYLFSEGFLKSKEEIKNVVVDDRKGIVRVETKTGEGADAAILSKRLVTSGSGRGSSFYKLADAQAGIKIDSRFQMLARDVLALVGQFQCSSELHEVTRGVHSAALCDERKILVFADDIGRHNAIDKIIGRCILVDVAAKDHGLIFSGRISSEMLLKAARRDIPVVISIASPTNVAVRMANDMGMTVVGMVRGKKMNIYSGDWRIVTDEG